MIEVERLSKRYGAGAHAVDALDAVDLSVARGEIVAVVGPSGSGKSTLGACVTALTPPTSGTVSIDGRPLTGRSGAGLRELRRSIGTVFQASSLLGRRTAADNVALPLDYLRVTRADRDRRVGELLERVGLGHRAHHRPHELSGGERQRVGIARALALRPSVLVADEPTSGLDADATASILDLLDELRRELGLTVLLITHEMDVVRRIADGVVRLAAGRVEEQGRVAGLVVTPTSRLGRSLLPSLPAERAPTGQTVWRVSYGSGAVPDDWLQRLGDLVDGPVSLLGATVQTVQGVRTGEALVSLTVDDPEVVTARLLDWGLVAEIESPPPAAAGSGDARRSATKAVAP
ncbi:methionine ABC transporter ATP-binding protein [Patulibacter sp. NPDC049589]|uniref:methionine ABC transporter ATP-binding protein n=1 Tax=Patulibacter sp. NPDC049589 TaxID=3154731 RepID=UPI003426B079